MKTSKKPRRRRKNSKVTLRISNAVIRLIRLLLWAANIVLLIGVVFIKLISKTLQAVMLFFPRLIATVIPKKQKRSLSQLLVFAGVKKTSNEVVAISIVYAMLATMAVFIITVFLEVSVFTQAIAMGIAFVSVSVSPLVFIYMLINKRVENVDQMLPDVLSIISQNMASGMTSYNALWTAARPEFGPVAEELQLAAKDTLTGAPLTDALFDMTQRVRSERLARSIRLIIQGINSGGDLPEVLENISDDMRMEINLRNQMASETTAQAMFIMFATMVGAPMLLAVSLQFISMFSGLMETLDVGSMAANMPEQSSMFTLSELAISPAFFEKYSVLILFISSFFASLLVGILRKGKAVSGVPNIPVFVVVSISAFLVIRYAMSTVFGSMMVL